MSSQTDGRPSLDTSTAQYLVDAAARRFESEQLEWLEKLVNQPSHSHAVDDVEAAARVLDSMASQVGLTVSKHASGSEELANHRVYATPVTAKRPALALVGHIDTVFPRASGFLSYSRAGDVARGPGVLDMKSGLTVILFALRALRDVMPSRFQDMALRFICVTDEEIGSPSSRRLYDSMATQISHALVFEKGRDGDRIVTCRKGGGTFRVVARGKAAHAGNDHSEGINAICALARVIPEIEAMTDYARGTTVNVGLVEGGTAKNTVPEHANCTIDARFVKADDARTFGGRLKELVGQPLRDPRLSAVTLSGTGMVTRPPMEATADNRKLCNRYGLHAEAVGLDSGEAPRQGGFSDSNLLAALGIPTIDGLGPFGDGAHSHDEWCSLTSLLRRTQALALFLAEESYLAETRGAPLLPGSRE